MSNKNGVTIVRSAGILPARRAGGERGFVMPSTDVYETPDSYVITVDMPGVSREAIHVTMDQNSLVVKGSIGEKEGGKPNILVAELQRTGYYRVFNLGKGIDRDSIDARYEDGVLTVKLLKKEELRPREISIR
jgi:HSP20 family protein